MKYRYSLITCVFITNLFVTSAKIHGGPRGRFDNHAPRHSANHHVVAHHAYFSYHPPNHILYVCRYCAHPTLYPVYHGQPPSYVYKYRETGTRFGDLLTGLALYNLGRAADDPYWRYSHFHTQHPDEGCSMQVIDRSHFEETRFPCFMMSSFMEQTAHIRGVDANTFDITSSQIDVKSYIKIAKNSSGSPLTVTREQECIIWHNATMYKEKNNIPCSLLKQYADTMKPSGIPVYIWLPSLVGFVIFISVCVRCCCKPKKEVREESPLQDTSMTGYCTQY